MSVRKQTSVSYAADCDVIRCYDGAKLNQRYSRSIASARRVVGSTANRRTMCLLSKLACSTSASVNPSLATAKLNDVEPFAYLKDVLERMSNGHPMTKLGELLPWNWTPSNAKA
jgi:hypothetical protein